jgi:hypothetical protein
VTTHFEVTMEELTEKDETTIRKLKLKHIEVCSKQGETNILTRAENRKLLPTFNTLDGKTMALLIRLITFWILPDG